MKLVHLSDLHIGKRVFDYPFSEDQSYALNQILDIIRAERPDAVAIAGDVYDKSIPSQEAVELFDDFIVKLAALKIPVFIISGNHDSAERLSFLSRLIDLSGVHFSPVYDGKVLPYKIKDEFGEVNIYMLPFVKPAAVRRFFDGKNIETYTDAVKACIDEMNVNKSERNVLIAHQFVTGAEKSESEDVSVGGLDNVDGACFDGFDYVALGHLHRPQNVGSPRIRYSGTPLKYSFSEVNDIKSVTVADIGAKGEVDIKTVPIKPLREMKEIRGKYNDIMLRSFYENTTLQSDYLKITLLDEDDVVNAAANLKTVYKNLMRLEYDNKRTRSAAVFTEAVEPEKKTPLELFGDLYKKQQNRDLSDEQKATVGELIEKIWEKK